MKTNIQSQNKQILGEIFIQLLISVLFCGATDIFVANGYSVCFLRGRLDLHTATYRTLTTREIRHPLTKETNTRRRNCLIDYKEDEVVSLTTKETDTKRRSCLIDYKEDRHEKTELSP